MFNQKSKTKYLKLNEKFNTSKLEFIINNFDNFKQHLRIEDGYNPLTILSKYLHRSRNGSIRVDYRQKDGCGRFNAIKSLSMQNIQREIRHTIAKEYYKDIDMVNAHPVILQFLCNQYGFECNKLNELIENRDKLLLNIKDDDDKPVSREQAKKLYLSLTNGGNKDFKKINLPSNHLKDYKDEMLRIHNNFSEKFQDEFKAVKDKRIKNNKDFNHEAGFMNTLLCDMENKILMCMYEYFGSPDNAVLCFDGLMLLINDENDKPIKYNLKKCMKHIKQNIGIDIKLKIKKWMMT